MMNSPCAMLMTPIIPNTMARPSAERMRNATTSAPSYNTENTSADILVPLSIPAPHRYGAGLVQNATLNTSKIRARQVSRFLREMARRVLVLVVLLGEIATDFAKPVRLDRPIVLLDLHLMLRPDRDQTHAV